MRKKVWNEDNLKALERMARGGMNPYNIAKELNACHETVRKKMRELGLIGLAKKSKVVEEKKTMKRIVNFEDVRKKYLEKYKVGDMVKRNRKNCLVKEVCPWQLILTENETVTFVELYQSECLREG